MSTLSSLNDIRQGITIVYHNEPHVVLKASFVRMQQRKPVMQTKLRNLITHKVIEYNFKPGDKVEEAEIQKKKVNYLYKAGNEFFFMDKTDYEQISLSASQVDEKKKFLKDGCEVSLIFFNNTPISMELPPKMDFKVVTTVEGVKGDTAQGRVTKEATLENSSTIHVPLFVKEGDTVRVNTETGEYVERV